MEGLDIKSLTAEELQNVMAELGKSLFGESSCTSGCM